ncbi:hypothetical protein [Terrimonas ferruginea]|uniref:hypothetical protein n=1 Tax=Terrimonas ferruginea TaxID=249 RepID=UPI0012DC8541|nr:hypothetical protein [Terrimonas ferruginea]
MYKDNPDIFNSILHLKGERTQESLINYLDLFFYDFPLHVVRETLSEMLKSSLYSENTAFSKPRQRQHLLWFCRELERLVEVAECLRTKDYH